MKRLLLALALALPLIAGDSLVLTSGDSLSYNPPDTTPWTALDARRVEMAIDLTNWNCTGSTTSRLWGMGGDLFLGCGATATSLYLRDGSRFWEIANAASYGEVLIRFSRSVTQTITPVTYPSDWLEIWKVDGTGYTTTIVNTFQNTPENLTTENASGSQTIGGTGIIAQIHWVKQYSTVIWPGPASPMPGTLGTGDLGDWSFDGSTLTDSSGLGMTISGSGHTFETTPAVDPTPSLNAGQQNWYDAPTVRAGTETTLTGTCSTVAATLGCTCVWSDQSAGTGPDSILFTGSTTACTTTAVFPTFGSYTLRLVATDTDANVGTRDFEIGAVAQDSTQHVVYPTANEEFIVGPQLAFGNSQWPWFDERRKTIGNWMGNRIPDPATIGTNTVDWGKPGGGTVTVTNGSPTVQGAGGTNFQVEFCGGGTTPSNFMLIIDDAGLYWRGTISSCTDADTIVLANNWNLPSDSGLSYVYDVNYGDWGATGASSEAQNFYDNCLAYGAMYFGTGHTRWLDWHNTCGDIWWNSPQINHGQCREGPTAGFQCANMNVGHASNTGLMLWAEVNGTQSTFWPGIEEILVYHDGTWGGARDQPSTDFRPSGYAMAWEALAAHLDPDATREAAWKAKIDDMLGDLFSVNQQSVDGAWYHGSNNGITGAGTVNVTNGSPTVTCPGANCGFQDDSITTTLTAAITSNNSTSAISVTSTAAFSTSGIIKIDNELISYSGKTGTTFTGITRSYSYTQTGATHSNGATVQQMTHEGRYFTAYANSADSWNVNGRRGDYLIASVDSPTQITLATNFTGTTGTGLTWKSMRYSDKIMQPFIQAMPMAGLAWLSQDGYSDERQKVVDTLNYNRTRGYRAHTGGYYWVLDDAGCQANIDAGVSNTTFDCQFNNNAASTNFQSDRYLMQEPIRGSAWGAKYARDLADPNATALSTHVDTMMGHIYGKWGGPQADFNESTCSTCYAKELEDTSVTFTATPKNKNWGFGFGFGGGYVWDALRDGDPEAESLTDYSVPLDIAGVALATKASVTLYEPKGAVSRVVNNQTGSAATVTGDSRQGTHLAKVEYKNAMDTILQTDYVLASEAVVSGDPATSATGSGNFVGNIVF